jgi:hypothetical protein
MGLGGNSRMGNGIVSKREAAYPDIGLKKSHWRNEDGLIEKNYRFDFLFFFRFVRIMYYFTK